MFEAYKSILKFKSFSKINTQQSSLAYISTRLLSTKFHEIKFFNFN